MSSAPFVGAALSVVLGIILDGQRTVCAAERSALQIQLVIDPCADVDSKEVRRLLRIELDAELLLPDASVPIEAVRAAVTCEESNVAIRIDDPITGKSLGRRLALRTAATATQARLLALALAELLLASWAELSLGSSPEPPAAVPIPLKPDTEQPEFPTMQARLAANEQVRRHTQSIATSKVELGLQPAFLSFPREGIAALFGGALRAAFDLRYRLYGQLELYGYYGKRGAPEANH